MLSPSQKDLIIDIPGGYRYSPLSPLLYFDRTQDASFRKSRATVTGRKVLWLWLSRMRVEAEPVWVGFISRDLGPQRPSFKAIKVD